MPKPLSPEQIEALRAVPLGAMPNKLRIALALAKARQSDIVEEIGIAAPHVSQLVNGRYTNVTIDTARKYAEFFGCAIEDLFPMREEVSA
jgi:transcriptional regulator with XRE-family HTH domain